MAQRKTDERNTNNNEVTIENVKGWVTDRQRYFLELRNVVMNGDADDITQRIMKAEEIEGSIRALELVQLMLSGMYSCEYCSGKHTSCEHKKNRDVCVLFDFDLSEGII